MGHISAGRWGLRQAGPGGTPGRLVRFLAPEIPSFEGDSLLVILGHWAPPVRFALVFEETIMRVNWTNSLQCLLALGLVSGLVACGSFANCFNSGFAPAACGGGYSASDMSSMPQSTATSAEGRWTGVTPTGRTVSGLVLKDGSYWLFYTATDNPNILGACPTLI